MTDALVAQFRRPGAHGAGVSRARGSARPQSETLPPSQLLLGAARTPGPVGSWFHSAPLSAHGADLTVLVSSGKVNTLRGGGKGHPLQRDLALTRVVTEPYDGIWSREHR